MVAELQCARMYERPRTTGPRALSTAAPFPPAFSKKAPALALQLQPRRRTDLPCFMVMPMWF